MFDYEIRFSNGSGAMLEGYEINIPKSYEQGYVEYESARETCYLSTHNIVSIVEKRVDHDV